MQLPYRQYTCVLGESPRLADSAAAIGRTSAGARLTLLEYATVRADGEFIRIGRDAWLAERATVHIVDGQIGTTIGDEVTVGRYALVHACTLGNRVVVGEGAAVMDGAMVGDDVVVAADSIVAPGKQLPGGWLYQGVPAQPLRQIAPSEAAAIARSIRDGAPDDIVRSAVLPPLSVRAFLPAGAGAGPLHSWLGRSPHIGAAYVAPTAAVIGKVELRDDAGIYFGCVVSAGDGRIVIGPRTNVQDNSFLITSAARGDLVLGAGITIGHNVQMRSGRFGDDALIGMMSRLEDDVVVEAQGCVAAGAWVASGTVVKSGWIWAGRPARAFRELRPAERVQFARGRDVYIGYGAAYRAALAPR
ncbi:MAG TPA: gamma carbonic anhydrase family protein [Casimicrobiaceae bacterium]|nr:gamma carbonic anhydrase family protein [Casimicrobiaceae bacterium]